MEVKYDTQLMEDVVIEEVERNGRGGDSSLYQRYHKIADLIYELSSEEQEEQFERLYSNFFFKLGKDKDVKEVLDGFPWLENMDIGIKKADPEEGSFFRNRWKFHSYLIQKIQNLKGINLALAF